MVDNNITLFEELFSKSPEIKYPKEGEVVNWVVVKIEKKNILVNVNNQFSGLVISREVGNTVNLTSLNPWDPIEVMVLWDSVERWLLILSLKRANQIKNLSNLSKFRNSEEVIKVTATEANKWGLLVDIDWLKWFIPVSQLTPINYPRVEWADAGKILEHLEWLVWKEFKVRVINVDEDGKKIIFSEKAAISENRSKALETLKEWDVVEWTVSWILTYWLFITFDWLEWLVHVSEIDWGHVTDPSKFANVWEKIKVKVIWLDNDKISLSIKRLQENPWDVLAKKYKVWDVVKTTISRISQFWAFLNLDWWIQWLIHLSEISHGVVKDIRDHIKVWQEVEAKIINFEPKTKRIWLSLKALVEAPKREENKEIKEEKTQEDKEQNKDLWEKKVTKFIKKTEVKKEIEKTENKEVKKEVENKEKTEVKTQEVKN